MYVLDEKIFLIEGEEYKEWGNDDNYLENLIFKKLGLIKILKPDPVQEPIQDPVQEPIQDPVQEPIQEPIQDPVQEPVQLIN